MHSKNLDRTVPAVYVGLIILSAIFFPIALGPIAIFGAVALMLYYSYARRRLRSMERDLDDDPSRRDPDMADPNFRRPIE